jgi:periplasmic protein TonB
MIRKSRASAATISVSVHILFAILLFCVSFPDAVKPIMPAAVHLFAPPPLKPFKTDGGGGQRQPLPAVRGHAPELVVQKVFTPPMVVRNEAQKLVVLASLADAPESNISSPQIGDPLAGIGAISGGFGGPVGIGNGGTGGIGNGNGPRQGSGGSSGPPVKLTHDPELIYKEEPEFSEEARKARHEGTVVIALEVDTNGRPINIRVVKGLGMGLDERAVTAVSHWKFRPAMSGNRAVVAPALANVSFHLL